MAIVPYSAIVTINLMGARKGTRSKEFEIAFDSAAYATDPALELSNVRLAAENIVTEFGSVTKAPMTSYVISYKFVENAPATPAIDANVYEEAILTVGIDTANVEKHTVTIPAPADGIFVNDDPANQTIDVADADIGSFLTVFASGRARVSDGEQLLGDVLAARLRSVPSGKKY